MPDPRELLDDELLARIRALYSGTALAEIEKEWEARRRDFARFEQSLPDHVPHILEKGSDKVAYDILKRLADGPLPDAACEVGLHRGCWWREESLSAQQAVQDSAQGKGGDLCLTPPLLPHHWGVE